MSSTPDFPTSLLGYFSEDDVLTSAEECRAYSSDVYSAGRPAVAVLRPKDRADCVEMIRKATAAGCVLIPRGGGLSYTGGYRPVHDRSVIIDTSRLDRIIEVNAEDMYITVEAGVTWKQIHDTLTPLGLRPRERPEER